MPNFEWSYNIPNTIDIFNGFNCFNCTFINKGGRAYVISVIADKESNADVNNLFNKKISIETDGIFMISVIFKKKFKYKEKTKFRLYFTDENEKLYFQEYNKEYYSKDNSSNNLTEPNKTKKRKWKNMEKCDNQRILQEIYSYFKEEEDLYTISISELDLKSYIKIIEILNTDKFNKEETIVLKAIELSDFLITKLNSDIINLEYFSKRDELINYLKEILK